MSSNGDWRRYLRPEYHEDEDALSDLSRSLLRFGYGEARSAITFDQQLRGDVIRGQLSSQRVIALDSSDLRVRANTIELLEGLPSLSWASTSTGVFSLANHPLPLLYFLREVMLDRAHNPRPRAAREALVRITYQQHEAVLRQLDSLAADTWLPEGTRRHEPVVVIGNQGICVSVRSSETAACNVQTRPEALMLARRSVYTLRNFAEVAVGYWPDFFPEESLRDNPLWRVYTSTQEKDPST